MASVLVIGSSNTDLVCRATRIPEPGETITGRSFATYAGGKGANQAVAAKRSGAEVTFVGARGDDDFGVARMNDLRDEGIEVSRMRVVAGMSSGVALIVVDDNGENQIVYVPGANAEISIDDAGSALRDVEHRVRSLTFEVPFATVSHAVRDNKHGAVVVLNAAPYDQRVPELLPFVDVLICNEIEAGALLGRPVSVETALADARAIVNRGPKAALLTLGASGAFASDSSGEWHVPAPVVKAIDTTGAGDAFCGAVCAWLAGGATLQDAVRAGVAAGSLAVTREGAQASLPIEAEILATMQTLSGT